MADLYGSNYAGAYQSTKAGKNYPPGEKNGNVQVVKDTFSSAVAVIGTGDKIFVGKIPAGATIVGGFINAAAQGAGSLALGVTGTTAGIVSTTAVTTAAAKQADGVLLGKKVLVETDVFITPTVATSASIGALIEAAVFFILN